MIKYRTRFNEIKAIEVLRETDKQVVILVGKTERREHKVCDWYAWHDTWEDSHAFLIAEAEENVNSLRLRLEQAKGTLGQIKGMKPSDK
jgi:hypothetical protein